MRVPTGHMIGQQRATGALISGYAVGMSSAAMLKSGRSDAVRGLCFNVCSCCNTRRARRAAKKRVKQAEKRAWKREVRDDA